MEPTQWIAALKLPMKVVAGVAVATLALLALPTEWLSAIALDSIRDTYRVGIGLVFVFSVALLSVHGLSAVVKSAAKVFEKRYSARQASALQKAERDRAVNEAREAQERAAREAADTLAHGMAFLSSMTDAEKSICADFISNGARTRWLPLESGVVTELARRNVIYRANQFQHVDMKFDGWGAEFTMQDWAWGHLHENPNLLTPSKPIRRR